MKHKQKKYIEILKANNRPGGDLSTEMSCFRKLIIKNNIQLNQLERLNREIKKKSQWSESINTMKIMALFKKK